MDDFSATENHSLNMGGHPAWAPRARLARSVNFGGTPTSFAMKNNGAEWGGTSCSETHLPCGSSTRPPILAPCADRDVIEGMRRRGAPLREGIQKISNTGCEVNDDDGSTIAAKLGIRKGCCQQLVCLVKHTEKHSLESDPMNDRYHPSGRGEANQKYIAKKREGKTNETRGRTSNQGEEAHD